MPSYITMVTSGSRFGSSDVVLYNDEGMGGVFSGLTGLWVGRAIPSEMRGGSPVYCLSVLVDVVGKQLDNHLVYWEGDQRPVSSPVPSSETHFLVLRQLDRSGSLFYTIDHYLYECASYAEEVYTSWK